ncbi:MAG: xanthine dehydrogenase molybdopterin binding subunit [Ignavibacteria bacterium]|nr:xanthine dehydrogenase molybdopterin binding subunit [Ignavibacteria bacterium]
MTKHIPHESAELHVSGEALYVDDISASPDLLVGRVVYSPHARARIISFDLTEAKQVPGVAAILSARDIPGHNQMGPVVKDEPCLASEEVTFVGQAIFLIAAETDAQCRAAEKKIKISFEPLEPILTLDDAMARNNLLGPPRTMSRGDADSALQKSVHVIEGELRTGAAEHWYLETQSSLSIPGEGEEMMLYSSSQNPSETQALVAEVLGVQKKDVVVEVRRMGGGFGGKETQGNHVACWSALLAHATRRPVKIRLFRDDDMIMTGKRHRFLVRYKVGFDDNGKLEALKVELNSDAGAATDLSFAIMERAMLHCDNAYVVPHMHVVARVWKTNLPSNTAFRGFGGPQAIATMEHIIDRIARTLHRDPAEIRQKNFYGLTNNNVTHYGQRVEENRLHTMFEQLVKSSDYAERRRAIRAFNASNEFFKKGIALTPVKFGISFTTTFLNQAGALVNIYNDGTVLVNHGGTEMGQGLHTKIRQIAARELGVSLDRIRVNATNTSKVPNTSPTAASTGTDVNGMAVRNAIGTLKERIAESISSMFNEEKKSPTTNAVDIRFERDEIFDSKHPARRLAFADAMRMMVMRQVSLSATGYYRTPGIGWDKIKGHGTPFRYFAFGMAVSEVLVDVLTGAVTLLRTDILHDAGDSVNPAIDIGQIEGGYIQGVGWCTTEEIKWDAAGNLMTHSPDTYKIPTSKDIPLDFRVSLLKNATNPNAIHGSKTVAEPPLMLGISTWLAIKDAISAVTDHNVEPEFSLPATNEVVLLSIEKLKCHTATKASPHTIA